MTALHWLPLIGRQPSAQRGGGHTGNVTNVAETCHPDNDFQLTLYTQTQPNTTDDPQMLADELPSLVERTDAEKYFY